MCSEVSEDLQCGLDSLRDNTDIAEANQSFLIRGTCVSKEETWGVVNWLPCRHWLQEIWCLYLICEELCRDGSTEGNVEMPYSRRDVALVAWEEAEK